MGNKASTQLGKSKETSKSRKKAFKNQQKLRQKEKQQKKLKNLRSNKTKTKPKPTNHKTNTLSPKNNHTQDNIHVNVHVNDNVILPNTKFTIDIISRNEIIPPKSPILEPNIEENVSDIEEEPPEETEAETSSLHQYLTSSNSSSKDEETATLPTSTDSSEQDRSFGMDSFDSSASPNRNNNVEVDTIGIGMGMSMSILKGSFEDEDDHINNQNYINNNGNINININRQTNSSPLFAIKEVGDNCGIENDNKPPLDEADNINNNDDGDGDGDDDDQFSVASSQSGDVCNGDVTIGDVSSIDGSESLLSQGTSTEFDNMSKGGVPSTSNTEFDNMSKGGVMSITEMSLSSIPSLILKNKQQQQQQQNHISSSSSYHTSMTTASTPSFFSSRSRPNNFNTSMESIHNRRKNMKRSRSTKSTKGCKKPNASNAFETLPRHLIVTGLLRQTAATLRDERFLLRRIEKLGAVYASTVHVSDFELLQKRDRINCEKRESKRDMEEGGGLEAELPGAQTFPEGDDYFSVMMDSFDLFLKCIMDLCGISINEQIFQVEEGCEELLDESDDENDHEINRENENIQQEQNSIDEIEELSQKFKENILPSEAENEKEAKITPLDGGKAILALGKFLQERDWIDDAMHFYRRALYLLLLEVEVDEPRLLDEGEDCDGLFYVDVSNEGSKIFSPAQEFLGIILTKMGDVHGKNLEVNDALRAYRASQVFWATYLADHEVTIKEECNVKDEEDLDELTDYAASVEGLALSHNRVGAVYTSKGDLPAALESFHEALDLQIDALGDEHIEVAKTLHNIGVCHRHNDEWDEALDYYERAHLIFEVVLGKDHLDTARTLHNIGGVHRRQKSYQEAIVCFKEVLRIRRKNLGDDHPSVSIALVSIAAALRRAGKKEEANKFYAAAVE